MAAVDSTLVDADWLPSPGYKMADARARLPASWSPRAPETRPSRPRPELIDPHSTDGEPREAARNRS